MNRSRSYSHSSRNNAERGLFSDKSRSEINLRRLRKGSVLPAQALEDLKYRYWSKSIKGSKRRLAWKTIKMFLFFVGTAGLNAFTQEKILGQHTDAKLPKPCYGLIKTGAGWDWRALAVPMFFMATCTCISNMIARAKAFGGDCEGFCVDHKLNLEQKRRLLLIDKAFLKLASFPSDGAENVFYISQDDINFFGEDIFQDYMDLMYSRVKFHLVKNKAVRDLILGTKYFGQAKKCNFINFNSEDISNRSLLIRNSSSYNTLSSRGLTAGSRKSPILDPAVKPRDDSVLRDDGRLRDAGMRSKEDSPLLGHHRALSAGNLLECRHIPVEVREQTFDWHNFRQEIKRVVLVPGWRGNATRLWRAFLWISFKGFPAFQVILQLSKALHSLEKAFGIKDDASPWIVHALCLAFNLIVAFNRAFINNKMKGNEIYRLIEKRNTYKTYELSTKKTQRIPNIKAIAASSLPILVTVLYFTFTSLFFASEGPISLAKQFTLLVPKSWGHPRLHSGFQYFLLNFITYGAVLSGLAVGIPTTCRAIYKELYEYFSESNDLGAATLFLVNDVEGRQGTGIAESSAWKARFCCPNITRGMLIFYVATFFDSTGFGFNAFYNSMQAMLAPSQLSITNKLGGCHFLLILALTVAVGITATSMAWTKYNGDEKYESFTGLWKKDGISHHDLVEHEPFILMEDYLKKDEEGGVSRQGPPVEFWGNQHDSGMLPMPTSKRKKGRGTPSPQQNNGRETPRATNF